MLEAFESRLIPCPALKITLGFEYGGKAYAKNSDVAPPYGPRGLCGKRNF